MAGHSHWAGIKHKKAIIDAKRGKLWSKIARIIIVAARSGGGDPAANLSLRYAIDKAKAANMPKDTIEKAVKKGTGDLGGANYVEVLYEGYGPGGIAVIVDAMTDNVNRTVGEVRHAFTKHGGNLGTSGSVAFQFQKLGIINFAPGLDEEALMEAALEAGAEDIQMDDDGSAEIITTPEDFSAVKDALVAAGFTPDHDEVTLRADNLTLVEGETAEKLLKMIDLLEDLDDVQEVFTNADFTDEDLEAHG